MKVGKYKMRMYAMWHVPQRLSDSKGPQSGPLPLDWEQALGRWE